MSAILFHATFLNSFLLFSQHTLWQPAKNGFFLSKAMPTPKTNLEYFSPGVVQVWPVQEGGHEGEADVEVGVPLEQGAAQPHPAHPAILVHIEPALAKLGGHHPADKKWKK